MPEYNAVYEGYLKSLHPRLADEPDHPLVLEPAQEARLRAQAEASGADYDRLKHDFLLSHQIVSPGKSDEEIDQLIGKNAIPLDWAQKQFSAFIGGAVLYKQLKKPKA